MIQRELLQRPDYVYPVEEWRMVERRFYPKFLAQAETLFTTANGYLGMRGTPEEGTPICDSGTFVNGFYESWPIVYGERAFGFARTGQTVLNATNTKLIKLYVDDEPFFLPTANLIHFERALDMKAGTLDREILWETPSGLRVSIKSRRLVSFRHRHLAAISYEVTLINAEAPVVISSEAEAEPSQQSVAADPRRAHGFRGKVLVPRIHRMRDDRLILAHQTNRSRMTLACGVDHVVETRCRYTVERRCEENSGKVVIRAEGKPGLPIRLKKYMAYFTSRSASPEELSERAERALDRATGQGFRNLLEGQRSFVADFWRRSDVEVKGDPAAQQAIRFNLYQVLQAAARAEGAGIPAKGLTGQGYEGHYFWDVEIYVNPFLTYTNPRIARNLLKFRHGFLDKARARARDVNQKGALFPWRTINGDEASAYYAAGTAQYHINADVAYALRKYVEATGDREALYGFGAEILIETARLWRDLGFFSPRKGDRFCIHGVTGPDEYNTVVNNNTFTNLMARENLWYAAETMHDLERDRPERFAALALETGLDEAEIDEWRRAADCMLIPYDEELGIHPQDDSFLDKKVWDLDGTPEDKFPLLLHYHPLVIYRHAVVKQADVVLAMFLLGHHFTMVQKKRNFDFYDPLTTGDSSLSAGVQSIVAAELGYEEKALEYGRYALLMDLADVSGNVRDGIHIASAAGTWMAVVYGLAGMRDYRGEISFRPRLPRGIDQVGFALTIRGQVLEVEISREEATYTLREGDGLTFSHEGEEIRLTRTDRSVTRWRTARAEG